LSEAAAGGRLAGSLAAAKALVGREPFLAAVTLLALLYVAASLSPSAYGLVLKSFGVADDGLVFGWPQWIRSDEYAIWTPTVQAAVANDFGPVNLGSLYAEPLRTLSALPLADWGILFKPEFWPFFLVSPARAFSAYHAFHYWLFLVAWTLFFRRLGVRPLEAALAAIVLLDSAWAQVWWTSLGPILVYAPLFLLPLLYPLKDWQRFLAAFYVAAMWLMDGLFYPPLYLAMTVTLLLAILAFRPEALRLRPLAAWGAGAAGGIALAGFYLWDSILATASTTVHGGRNQGGGLVSWQDYLGTFLPSFPYHGWMQIFGGNACEASSTGSILWPLILFFALPASWLALWRDREARPRLRQAAGLVVFLVLASVWIVAKVPAIWGKPLLWHLTLSSRLLVLPGILLLVLALFLLPRLELRWTVLRASLFALLAAGAWYYTKHFPPFEPPWYSALQILHKNADLALIPLAFALPLFEWARRRLGWGEPAPPGAGWRVLSPASLLAAAAAANIFFFGFYNPLQSTRPIFAEHDTPLLRSLREMADAHPRGWLVAGGVHFYGSILNGLGFRSVNHTLLNPELARFSRLYPGMPKEEREKLFNRYINVQVSPYSPPHYSQALRAPLAPRNNALLVAPEQFLPRLKTGLAAAAPPLLPPAPGGLGKKLIVGNSWWVLDIQGPIGGIDGKVGIEVHTDPPARRLIRTWRLAPQGHLEDFGKDYYSRMLIELAAPADFASSAEKEIGWCVVLHDPVAGPRQIAPLPGQGRSTCGLPPAAARPAGE
jgi:hypothetical protein